MPLSNSVIRRYTPPTCTLEVGAQSSALSRWVGKSVLKQLRFELRFDDPRLPEEERITIRGDRDQLEALCAVVANYVQEFLQKSEESFSLIRETQDSIPASENSYERSNGFNSNNSQMSGGQIRIEPSSHLTHKLFLGSLASQASTPVIQLTLLQLFDLATALDEYSNDVVALPNLNTNRSRSTFALPDWAPVAAVLVLAIGSMPFTLQYANRIRQKQQVASTLKNTQQKIALNESSPASTTPTPAAISPTATPLLTPPDNLLLQPPLGTTSALPAIPATPPTSFTAKPGTASKTLPSLTFPSASVPTTGSQLTVPRTQTPSFSINPGNTQLPTNYTGSIAIQPNSRQNSSLTTTKGKITAPQTGIPSSNPFLGTSNISPGLSPVIPPLASIPNDPRSKPLSPAASQPFDPRINSTSSGSSVMGNDNSIADRLSDQGNTGANKPTEVATGALFDSTPQIAEARDFLKKRWQPPEGLTQTLQYSLIVGIDGTIERIFPLGGASRNYFDTTGMPNAGQPFISPSRNGQALRIRAVLSPDGKVQTFPESE
jgi:hypothetical protein